MAKIIMISNKTIQDLQDEKKIEDMISQLSRLEKEYNKVFITGIEENQYGEKAEKLNFCSYESFLKELESSDESVAVVSGSDEMFKLAQGRKSLFVCPLWAENIGEDANKYGLGVETPKQMYQIIKHSNNNNFWHSRKELEDGTPVFTLLDAKFRYFSTSSNEEKMVCNFRDNLYGECKTPFFKILAYDLMSALSNKNEHLDEVDIWTVFPQSSLELSDNMMELKDMVETMTMAEKVDTEDLPDNLILRHTEKQLSHEVPVMTRFTEGAGINLSTIYLNPAFREKVSGATVCVMDDILNHGHSFEAARNLLKAAGAKKVILLALGVYPSDYVYENYAIKGDVFAPGFEFGEPLEKKVIPNPMFKVNFQVKVEVETLYTVFNS